MLIKNTWFTQIQFFGKICFRVRTSVSLWDLLMWFQERREKLSLICGIFRDDVENNQTLWSVSCKLNFFFLFKSHYSLYDLQFPLGYRWSFVNWISGLFNEVHNSSVAQMVQVEFDKNHQTFVGRADTFLSECMLYLKIIF